VDIFKITYKTCIINPCVDWSGMGYAISDVVPERSVLQIVQI